MDDAMAKVELLFGKVQRLQFELRRCARLAVAGGTAEAGLPQPKAQADSEVQIEVAA
jgi:hypothetical protein